MLDVHPPHVAPHTWRDFLIHIAMIVVGLLIAIGLEQTVEAVHHHSQRKELRESLRTDAMNAVQNTIDAHAYTDARFKWLTTRIEQVQQAIKTGNALESPPPAVSVTFEAPDDPAWKAARSTELSELLTQDEIKIYTDVDGDVAAAERFRFMMNDAHAELIQFGFKLKSSGQQAPYTSASPKDLSEYLNLLAAAKKSVLIYGEECQGLHGAEAALLRGENTLGHIQAAESAPW